MAWRLIRTILILPGTALVFVPGPILWLSHGSRFQTASEVAELLGKCLAHLHQPSIVPPPDDLKIAVP